MESSESGGASVGNREGKLQTFACGGMGVRHKTLETFLGCLKSRFEVSNYIHKPALYTQTMLLSARDGEQVLQKRGADVIGGEKARKTLLLSELHQALRQFGFDVQRGSVELIDHAGAVPAVTVALESVVS
jgi:hypothetical protein